MTHVPTLTTLLRTGAWQPVLFALAGHETSVHLLYCRIYNPTNFSTDKCNVYDLEDYSNWYMVTWLRVIWLNTIWLKNT